MHTNGDGSAPQVPHRVGSPPLDGVPFGDVSERVANAIEVVRVYSSGHNRPPTDIIRDNIRQEMQRMINMPGMLDKDDDKAVFRRWLSRHGWGEYRA